jgi:hypothetical protein
LARHRVRSSIHVPEREPKYPKPGADEQILPPVVLNEARPVSVTVVLDHKTVVRIVEIPATQETTLVIRGERLGLQDEQVLPLSKNSVQVSRNGPMNSL